MTPLAFIAKHAMAAVVDPPLRKVANATDANGIDWAKLWNDHKAKIIGGGVGALGGALGGAAMNPSEEEDPEANRWLRPLLGGLAGAGAGVGAGYGYEALGGWDGIKQHLGMGEDEAPPATDTPPQAPPRQSYAGPGAALGAPLGALGGAAYYGARGSRPDVAGARGGRSRTMNALRALGFTLGGARAGTAAGGGTGYLFDR